jgi:hypothetical protein
MTSVFRNKANTMPLLSLCKLAGAKVKGHKSQKLKKRKAILETFQKVVFIDFQKIYRNVIKFKHLLKEEVIVLPKYK